MGLVISKGLTFRQQTQTLDADAQSYVNAVEVADGQRIEDPVRFAINDFVLGCKADGIWNAIKASCILAGARTRLGALTPLVGTAPTSLNFVDGDYNRKTGLAGNASSKYLDSNRNNNADPQDSNHNAVYVSTAGTGTQAYIGVSNNFASTGDNNFGRSSPFFFRNRMSALGSVAGTSTATGLIGMSRASSANFTVRINQTTSSSSAGTSQTPFNSNVIIFAGGGGAAATNARLAFYSIGESLDLAILDARVTDLINAFAAAIP
jgi:hypothetical protein